MLKRLTLALALTAAPVATAAREMTCVPTRADAERLARLDLAWKDARADAIEAATGTTSAAWVPSPTRTSR